MPLIMICHSLPPPRKNVIFEGFNPFRRRRLPGILSEEAVALSVTHIFPDAYRLRRSCYLSAQEVSSCSRYAVVGGRCLRKSSAGMGVLTGAVGPPERMPGGERIKSIPIPG